MGDTAQLFFVRIVWPLLIDAAIQKAKENEKGPK